MISLLWLPMAVDVIQDMVVAEAVIPGVDVMPGGAISNVITADARITPQIDAGQNLVSQTGPIMLQRSLHQHLQDWKTL